jgi:hypothetical protein
MIKELAKLLDLFPGAENQTRCFTHILNLAAKSIIRQFDVPKAQQGQALDDSFEELKVLAVDIDLEEEDARDGVGIESDDNDEDNVDGWIDERGRMSDEDLKTLDKSVQPVRFMMVKVVQSPTPFLDNADALPLAAQNSARNQELLNDYPTRMVQVTRNTQAQSPHDATRCRHTMELYV